MRVKDISVVLVSLSVLVVSCYGIDSYCRRQSSAKPFQQVKFPGEKEGEEHEAFPYGIGTSEDINARYNYERMRLVDPTTGQIPANIREKELRFANRFKNKTNDSPVVWNRRGPSNVGGRTRAFTFDVDNESILLAGGVTGGMWRSTNGGNSFTQTTTPEQLHSVTCRAQDKRAGKKNIWYHGTGEQYGIISPSASASGNGIFKSTDSGLSWTLLPATISNTPTNGFAKADFDYVWNIITDHTEPNSDVVLAAVVNGIYRSADGGNTWNAVLGLDTTNGISEYTDIAITPSGVMYAWINGTKSYSGIWRSTDHGVTWTEITPSGWPASAQRLVIGITQQDENKLFFLTYTPGAGKNNHSLWHYTYASGTGAGAGGHWNNRSTNLPDYVCEVFYDFKFGLYSSQNGYDMCIAISPADSNRVFLGGTNVYRSTDGYQTSTNHDWIGGYRCDSVTPSNYVYPNHHPDQHVLKFSPGNSDVLYSANDGGIYKTVDIQADSVQWQSLNNGYMNSQFYAVAVEPGAVNSNIIVGGMQDNGTYLTTTDNAATPWKATFYGDGGYCDIATGAENYYLSWQSGKVFKFDIDNNGTVLGKTRIDPQGASGYLFIAPFMLDPADNNTMYLAAGKYLWRHQRLDTIPLVNNEYDPLAQGWEKLTQSVTGSSITAGSVSALAMSAADNNRIYYGTTSGALLRLDSLHSIPVKVNITGIDFPAGGYVTAIYTSQSNADEVIIAFSNYNIKSIFRSTNGGTDWENISGSLEENADGTGDGPAVLWVEALELPDSTVYFAGTSIGLFSTTTLNGAATQWKQESPDGLGNVIINMIKTRPHDGLVVAGTHGAGVYTARYKDYVGIPSSAASKLTVKVGPNPLQDASYFHYTLNSAANVDIKIYSLDGKVVKSIAASQASAGAYSLAWNGNDNKGAKVPAGVYIYEVKAGSQKVTGKIIVSR
jgi:hypothetical protein